MGPIEDLNIGASPNNRPTYNDKSITYNKSPVIIQRATKKQKHKVLCLADLTSYSGQRIKIPNTEQQKCSKNLKYGCLTIGRPLLVLVLEVSSPSRSAEFRRSVGLLPGSPLMSGKI